MHYNFSPSLEHMASVKIALGLYYDKDIERMLEEEWKVGNCGCCFEHKKNEFWKVIKKMAAEKLHYLPNTLKARVSKFIRPFHWETKKWSRDHECLLGISANGCYLTYKSILHWKADGTVDRIQTARKLAQDRNIDPETRFAVACTYFLEDEVYALWQGNEEVRLTRKGKNAAVRFWIKRVKEESLRQMPWNAMATRYFKTPRFRREDIPLRVGSFFPHLSWEGKKNYFVYLRENKVFSDDYRSCCQAMNETERMELFTTDPETGLHEYLEWPLQSLFIKMVNQLRSHMDTHLFQDLLEIIILCIFQRLDDFDYELLFKELWRQSPSSFKKAIKKDTKFFKFIEWTLNYDEQNAHLSLPETMDEFVRQYLICKWYKFKR